MILRDRFPILEHTTYLASHSLGAVPRSTEESLRRYYREWAELGIKAWDGPWWQSMLDFCALVEKVLGARPGTVAPMQNVTRAMAGVASCLDYGRRPRIVMPELEFTTSFPLWRGQERLGAEVVVVPSTDGVSVSAEALAEAVDERTALVLCSHAFFRSGALADLGSLVQVAHRHGAHVMGDGYQTAGAVPVEVDTLGVDFFVGGSHKWLCGGPGAGYLYVRPELVDSLRPALTGWFGLEDPFAYELGDGPGTPNPGVLRFLGGTPNVPAFYAAREGLATVLEVGVDRIRRQSREMTGWLMERLDARGFAIKTPRDPERRNGMVCFDFEGASEVRTALEQERIIVDWRPDCGLRVSPHFYNGREDLERFLEALDRHCVGFSKV